MTILSVVQNVCLAVGLDKPDVAMSSTDREIMELIRIANDVAALIRDAEFDWQALQLIHTITGDGLADAFDLPEDYARMPTKGTLWSSRWTWGMNQVESIDLWLEMLVTPYVSVTGDWIIFGDQLHLLPVMASTETVKFPYITNLIVKDDVGNKQTAFSADTDSFRLSERVLELGMIWKWKEQKGQPISEEENDYARALYTAMNNDGGSKKVISGNGRRRFEGVKPAYPFVVPH
jgi:hypothetical protein